MAFGLSATAHLATCAASGLWSAHLPAHASDQQRHLRHRAAVSGLERRLSSVLAQPVGSTRLIRSHLRSPGGVAAFSACAGGGRPGRYALQKDRPPHPRRYLRARSAVAALSSESVPWTTLRAGLRAGPGPSVAGTGARSPRALRACSPRRETQKQGLPKRPEAEPEPCPQARQEEPSESPKGRRHKK